MQKIKIDDLTQYRFLSGITASPSGGKAAFLVKKADMKKNDYGSWIYIVDFCTGEVGKLTSFGAEKNLIFDGEDTVLFSSVRGEEDKAGEFAEKTVFYRISLKGGEAERAFELPYAVDGIKKVSDGVYAFETVVDRNRPKEEEKQKEYRDYHVLEELPYWQNGSHFVSRFRNTLFLYDEAKDCAFQLTEPLFAMNGFAVSGKEGARTLVFSGVSYDDLLPMTSGIYEYEIKTGETKKLLGEKTVRTEQFACGDGIVYFAGSAMDKFGGCQNPDLYVCENGAVRMVAECGLSIGATPTGDISLGGGTKFAMIGNTPVFVACVGTTGELYAYIDGKVEKYFDFDGAVDCFAGAADGVAFVGRTPGKLQEIYFYDAKTKTVRQISDLNGAALKDKYVGKLNGAGFTDSDGVQIDGWVILPKDYDPEKQYPAILDMHGGPRVAFGDLFFHEMQIFANAGYFVLLCNPRGSDGRGNEFSDLRRKYGTVDYQDFMEFVDHALENYPAIDLARLGVTGGSYGGWMTNWIIGHTDRFAAAVSQRSFSNWLSDFGSSEIGFSFDVNENGGQTPWTDPKELWERSPVAYANRAQTPTLFIHSLRDHNCPLSEGMQMFAAIKYFGVPSKAVLFEGESHELSRSGKPLHRIHRLEEMKAWFDKYLMAERQKGD